MAGAERVTFELRGYREIRTKLTDIDALYGEPWRDAMEAVGTVGEQYGIMAAPLGATGSTVAKMAHKIQRRPFPTWAVIKTTARNPKSGYRYPRLVHYAARWHHLHWLSNALTSSMSVWGTILSDAADAVAAKWRA